MRIVTTRHRLAVVALAFMVVFPMLGGVGDAHHSRAGYDGQVKTTKGVVTDFVWKNPHVFIIMTAHDDQGNDVQWIGELSSVTTMMSAGMSKNSLKPGDEIEITGRSSSTLPRSLVRQVVRADGTYALQGGDDGGGFTNRTR